MKLHYRLRNKFAALFCVLISLQTYGANYHFSNSLGDDNRTSAEAQNEATPWKTLAKLAAWRASGAAAGDFLLLKRGDTWYEPLRITSFKDQINTIDAYGTGAKPVISGFYIPTTWSDLGGNKWETTVPNGPARCGVVAIGNLFRHMGRFPNKGGTNDGYLTYTSGTNTTITDPELPASPNYTGYELVVRKNRFIMDKGLISSHSGTTLTFQPSTHDGSTSGWGCDGSANGYFIQNSYDLLDAEGEWYYNNNPARLDVYTAVNPATQNIKVAVIDTLAYIYAQNNLKIRTIRFEGSNMETLRMNNDNYCTIQNCEFAFNGLDGFRIYACTYTLWDGNTVQYSGNNSGYFEAAETLTISNSIFEQSGIWPGMGKSNGLSHLGFVLGGTANGGNLVTTSIVNNVGYNGIHFAGNNNTIYRNYINNFNRTLDDGGGIYSSHAGYYESGRIVRANIITNGNGNGNGTGQQQNLASNGIYMDDKSGGAIIDSNFVGWTSETGIYVHNAKGVTIKANLVYNCPQLWRFAHDILEVNDPIREITMTDNFFFAATSTQQGGHYYSRLDDIHLIGTLDANYYSRPSAEGTAMFYADQPAGNTTYTLSQWTHAWHDSNSKPTPPNIVSGDSILILTNSAVPPSPVSLGNLEYVNLMGQGFTKTIQIPAYKTYLLIRKNLQKAKFPGNVKFVKVP